MVSKAARLLSLRFLSLSFAFLFISSATFFAGGSHARAFARSANLPGDGTSGDATLGARLYAKALSIFNQADVVHYEHHKADATEQVIINGDSCQAECDCSGFVCYVLRTVAPHHYESIENFISNGTHPLAKTFSQFFATLSPTEVKSGWLKIASYQDLRQGDLIAWEKAVNPDAPVQAKKGNTGHVMIVEGPAGRPEKQHLKGGTIRFVSVPVIDSSSVDHFPPEELPPRAHQSHRDGVGRGLIRLILNDDGQVIGYWEGTYWGEGGKYITKPSFTESVAFARPLHIRKHRSRVETEQSQAEPATGTQATTEMNEGSLSK